MHKFVAMLGFIIALSLPAVAQSQTSQAAALENAVNQMRLSNGATVLAMDDRLRSSAQMAVDFYVRTGCLVPDCRGEITLDLQATRAGYPVGAGRILWEFSDRQDANPEQVIAHWSNYDTGAMQALLDPDVTHIGCAYGSYLIYPIYVCDLGRPS